MKLKERGAQITKWNFLAIQACVPSDATDAELVEFVEGEHPAGTTNGWQASHDGDTCLNGTPFVVPCVDRPGFVHRVVYC